MIICFIFLAYRSTRTVASSSSICKIGDFGFETNSSYSIIFSSIGSSNLVYCLFSESEFMQSTVNQNLANQICHSGSFFPHLRFEIQNSNIPYTINGTITKPGIYSQIIANCDNSDLIQSQIILTLTEVFQNPTSTLDSRWKGIKKYKLIIIFAFSGAILFWIILLILHISSVSKLQILLSFTFLSYLTVCIFRVFEIDQLERFDNDGGFTLIREISIFVQKFLLYTSTLFISKGWQTVINHLPTEIIYYIFLILIFNVMLFLLDLNILDSFNITFLVISIFCACLVLQKIIAYLHDVRQYLLSKMISIINTTDYKFTAINKIRRKFVILEFSIIFFSFAYLALTVLSIFIKIPFCFHEILNDAFLSVFLIILMILFQGSKFDIDAGYASVSGDFSLTDLTPLDSNNYIENTHEVIEDDTAPTAASE